MDSFDEGFWVQVPLGEGPALAFAKSRQFHTRFTMLSRFSSKVLHLLTIVIADDPTGPILYLLNPASFSPTFPPNLNP
jgi:hypothetical protein